MLQGNKILLVTFQWTALYLIHPSFLRFTDDSSNTLKDDYKAMIILKVSAVREHFKFEKHKTITSIWMLLPCYYKTFLFNFCCTKIFVLSFVVWVIHLVVLEATSDLVLREAYTACIKPRHLHAKNELQLLVWSSYPIEMSQGYWVLAVGKKRSPTGFPHFCFRRMSERIA